jgi:hypothetical protein
MRRHVKWIKELFGITQNTTQRTLVQDIVAELNAEQARIKDAGSLNGEHYTDYVEQVKQLKREKRYSEAIKLLLKLVNAIEAESKAAGQQWGVAPWYYEQLAIIFRKEGRLSEEIAILERYEAQPKAPGVGPTKLSERLLKAKVHATEP